MVIRSDFNLYINVANHCSSAFLDVWEGFDVQQFNASPAHGRCHTGLECPDNSV